MTKIGREYRINMQPHLIRDLYGEAKMKRTIGPLKIIILLSCLLLLCSMISCGSGTIGIEENDTRVEDQEPPYKNDLYGYIDKEGNLVIEPQFHLASEFSEGLAAVTIEGERGYIDRTGKLVIDTQFFEAESFSEGLAAVRFLYSDIWGYIDSTSKFVIEPRFHAAKPFREGLAAVSEDGLYYGYVDKTGDYAIEPQWCHVSSFSEGLARVHPLNTVESSSGFIDKTGEYIIPPELIAEMGEEGNFHDGRAIGGGGYIDKTGKTVIDLSYRDAKQFSEGLAPVKVVDKWGYIDTLGSIVIEPQFDFATPFSDGLGLAGNFYESRYYFDTMGNLIIHSENGGSFHEGLAQFTNEEGKIGYMDKTGAVVIEPQFAEAGDFSEGLAWVKYFKYATPSHKGSLW